MEMHLSRIVAVAVCFRLLAAVLGQPGPAAAAELAAGPELANGTRLASAIPYLAEDVGGASSSHGTAQCIPPRPFPSKKGCTDCLTYAIHNEYEGIKLVDGEIATESDSLPECLTQLLEQKIASCKEYSRTVMYAHFSSCMLVELSGYNARTEWKKFWGNAANFFDGEKLFRRPFYYQVNRNGLCQKSELPEGAVCNAATLHWYISPISLLFDTDPAALQADSRIVKFALRPGGPQFSTWKASAKAPLLVYDPQHTGTITGASQLFGNWTFGGKAIARAGTAGGTTTDAEPAAPAWRNGFEALATLDQNADGSISGSELAPLGLWFDQNQNAVSEPGEVQPIANSGVTTLYYRSYSADPQSNDLVAPLGFERVINGITTPGTAVDWYGASADSEMDLAQKQVSLDGFCAPAAERSSPPQAELGDIAAATPQRPQTQDFVGVWNWRTAKSDVPTSGILIFADEVDGENSGNSLAGTSLVEFKLGSKGEKLHSVLPARLIAQVAVSSGHTPHRELQFSSTGSDGSSIESRATLNDDRRSMHGTSVVYTLVNGRKQKKSQYSWTAAKRSLQ